MRIGSIALMLLSIMVLLGGCEKDLDLNSELTDRKYKTENAIVVVIDGPRFTETWGDPERRHIPFMHERLAQLGTINTRFYNYGKTKTIPGHTAIITGIYDDMDNNGKHYPAAPSFLQHWLYQTKSNPLKAWVIASKNKLGVLSNCAHMDWRNQFNPSVDAYDRDDAVTFEKVRQVMNEHHPRIMFIHFRGPDYYGHKDKWDKYLHSIRETDSFTNEIQKMIMNDSFYAGKTTMIVTNDHGRHLDHIGSGFKSHGDRCTGCMHLNFYAYGPDFKANQVISTQRDQTDIAPTIGELLGFEMFQTEGEVMTELFIK